MVKLEGVVHGVYKTNTRRAKNYVSETQNETTKQGIAVRE